MCGRYSITTPFEALARLFAVTGPLPNLPPRYNLAPTQSAPVVRSNAGARELVLLRWGLIPAWSKEGPSSTPLINARAETVAQKPAFRSAFRARRCLVPADGFYEWQAGPKVKQPYHIAMADQQPFALAGLWERWQPKAPGEAAIESFVILTTDANTLCRPIHHRMPVIVAPDHYELWLTGPREVAEGLLRPYPARAMVAQPIGPRVNQVRNDDPACLEPLQPEIMKPTPAPPPRLL